MHQQEIISLIRSGRIKLAGYKKGPDLWNTPLPLRKENENGEPGFFQQRRGSLKQWLPSLRALPAGKIQTMEGKN